MFSTQYGRYSTVGTPSAPDMNAPHVFQGISGEVIVPPSSRVRERLRGARPLSA